MSFVQIIEYRSANIDGMQESADRWGKSTEGRRSAGRRVVRRDRKDPNHYFTVVFFDSYESAMQNSDLAETQRFSQEMMKLADGPPTFYDLDVVDDRS